MRLSRNNDRKLTQLVWRERLKRFGAVAAVAVLLTAGAVYYNYRRQLSADPAVSVTSVEATVIDALGRGNRKGHILHVRMADGHEVDAWVASGFTPAPGTHVILAEAHHKSGKLSYELIRTVEAP